MPREDIEVAPARGDDHRASEGAAEQQSRDTIRVKVMRIDQIKVRALPDLTAEQWQNCSKESQRRRAHPDLRQHGIARVIDTQALADLLPRSTGKRPITAEPRGSKGKPRAGRHDSGGNRAALDELCEARLDKNTVLGPQRARI